MKRRLKNEIIQKKKGLVPFDKNDEDAREFEESLIKLASLAKSKIKMSDLTAKDRFNVLDLFVNNEKTLIKIYEALFPHRVSNTNNAVSNVLTQKSIKSVKGVDTKQLDLSMTNSSKNADIMQSLEDANN